VDSRLVIFSSVVITRWVYEKNAKTALFSVHVANRNVIMISYVRYDSKSHKNTVASNSTRWIDKRRSCEQGQPEEGDSKRNYFGGAYPKQCEPR